MVLPKELFDILQKNAYEIELEAEAKRMKHVVDQAIADFCEAADQLFCAFVEKCGAGQIIECLPKNSREKERTAWVEPIVETTATVIWVNQIKSDEKFKQGVRLYHQACAIAPDKAQVVQFLKGDKILTVFRAKGQTSPR